MKILIAISFLLFIRINNPGNVFAQAENQFDFLKSEISNNIPPLEVLIDSAFIHDPYIQFRDLQIIINNCKLKANRVEWTRNIGFQADMRYGNFYNYSTNNTGGGIEPAIGTTRLETKYGAAVYLKLPVYDLINRKNQLKLAGIEIEQAQSMAEVQRNETRLIVIRQYNDLVLSQRLLRVKSKYLETARINMQMVEKEFSNGVISVTEYARISETVSRTESDYESARMDFLTAYMVLEELVGMKFNLTNTIPGSDEGN